MKKRIWLFGLILIALISLVCYMYYQPVPQLKNKKADFEFTANQLHDQYLKNEANTDQQLLNKIILVKGTVKTIIVEGNQLSVVLESGEEEGGVVCELDSRLPTPSLQPGQVVLMKGMCTGMLMQLDVILTRCVLIT